jgi:hypothetical protein
MGDVQVEMCHVELDMFSGEIGVVLVKVDNFEVEVEMFRDD